MASEIWKEEYKRKCMDIRDAMSLIQNNDLVSLCVLAPGELSSALHTRATELEQLHIRTLAPTAAQLYGDDVNGEREIEVFIGEPLRPAHDNQIATYLPNTFMLGMKASDNGRKDGRLPDVHLTSLARQMKQDMCNLDYICGPESHMQNVAKRLLE